MHLDPRTYFALIEGTLPPAEARALAKHLESDCELCERFLAERDRADELDGVSDAAIDLAFPPRRMEDDELAFARLQRRLRGTNRGRRWILASGAIAATLLVAAIAGTLVRRPGVPPSGEAWDGVKGSGHRAPAVHLRLATMGPAGDALPAASSERIDPAASLLFEVESDRSTEVVLARVAPDGSAELLWREHVKAGRTVVGSGGRAAAYRVSGLAGRQRFIVVAGAGLDPARAEQAVKAIAGAAPPKVGAGLPGGLVYDAVDVDVR
jgi:hypothetical protein